MKKQIVVVMTLAVALTGTLVAQEAKRSIKTQPKVVFPELAKRMNVSGAVKVEVIVAPNGTVKAAKAIGGHPLLIESAVTAAKNTKYEPMAEETKELIVFNFNNSGQ
jgi:TonB family protein